MFFHSAQFKWFVLGSVAMAAAIVIFSQSIITRAEITADENLATVNKLAGLDFGGRARRAPTKVKGLYLTAYSAGSSAKIDEIISLMESSELNAVVIDVKDYSGYILYDSKIPFVARHGLESVRIKNLAGLASKLHRHGIYAIARISVFQDPLLAEKVPEWAIKSKRGGLWRDKKGLAWVDPNKKEVWNHTVSVAREVAAAGFDEINFDYIRFPTDGPMDDIVYTNGTSTRYQVVENFFQYLSQRMSDAPVYLSADLFGLTTEKGGSDDMLIGQRLADAVKYFDYVCPMVYPSHYPRNYMDFSNPADHPYEVVFNAMKAGVAQAKGHKAKLRAWVQAFNMGAIYDGEKIRAQIDAADAAGADGWILWNAANRYSPDGLLAEDK